MLAVAFLIAFLPLLGGYALASSTNGIQEVLDASADVPAVCQQISVSVSGLTALYYPGNDQYDANIKHWATSSTQPSTCSVEPGSITDLSIIIQILGSTRTPFAIKSGGHTTNAGFSSTTGVQIAMDRFSDIEYDVPSMTAIIGSGLIWDDVYEVLDPLGLNVVGGRVSGVGVGGFTLGGGYSWLSNQYGLTIDNVIAYEIVLPNGTITEAAATYNPDLFFALKGGFNNFGVVTRFKMNMYPQSQVWGGLITFTNREVSAVNDATLKFINTNVDPKASIITTYNTILGDLGVSQLLFYDGPTPPAGIYDDFLAIPHFTRDVKTRSFLDAVRSFPANATGGFRGSFNTVSLLGYSSSLLTQINNQSKYWGDHSIFETGAFISYQVESFLPSYFDKSQGGAYPHNSNLPLIPLNLYFAWILEEDDSFFLNALSSTATYIYDQAIAEGQNIGGANQIRYPNYAAADTPLANLYGTANLARLKQIKAIYDPTNVMSLAGGFKF